MTRPLWKIRYSDTALKQFSKLDKNWQRKIQHFFRKKILNAPHPEAFGKPLSENLKGFWRYRVEDYRIICSIENDILLIHIVQVGHRREVYDD